MSNMLMTRQSLDIKLQASPYFLRDMLATVRVSMTPSMTPERGHVGEQSDTSTG